MLGVGQDEGGTTLSRRDRGYYHYNTNVAGVSFNKVQGSGRDSHRDTFGYFATCQNNENNYLGTKESNFFMGPSLYDSRPDNRNLVNLAGEQVSASEREGRTFCSNLHSTSASASEREGGTFCSNLLSS